MSLSNLYSKEESRQKTLDKELLKMFINTIIAKNVEGVKYLLDTGRVTFTNKGTFNPAVCVACLNNSVEIVKMLIEHGADVDANPGLLNDYVGGRAVKPIHCACYGEDDRTEIVKYLIDAGCNLECVDESRNTPIHFACRHGNIDVVKLLIEAGATVHKEDCKYETPLITASSFGNVDLMRILLDAGADPTALGSDSICRCIQQNCHEGVGLLYKVSQELVYDIGSQMARIRIMGERKYLLDGLPSDFEIAGDNVGIPTLHMACSQTDVDPGETVKTLLYLGADVQEKDLSDFNCLQHACSRVNVKCVRVLLDVGVNPTDHSWNKMWKAFPPINPENANNYLSMLKLLVFSGFRIDEETANIFKEATEATDLPEDIVQCFVKFLTRHRTVPQSLTSISRMRVRQCVRQCIRPDVDFHIGQLGNGIPCVLVNYLRFQDFYKLND